MKKSKREHTSNETFAELVEAAEQSLAYEHGAREGYRVTRVAVSSSRQQVSGKRDRGLVGGRRSMGYKGYKGAVTLDEERNIFHGEVLNTRDVITFQGTSLEECRRAFRSSVNDYLEFCRKRDEKPDKPL
jgi:hypothetical protein